MPWDCFSTCWVWLSSGDTFDVIKPVFSKDLLVLRLMLPLLKNVIIRSNFSVEILYLPSAWAHRERNSKNNSSDFVHISCIRLWSGYRACRFFCRREWMLCAKIVTLYWLKISRRRTKMPWRRMKLKWIFTSSKLCSALCCVMYSILSCVTPDRLSDVVVRFHWNSTGI